MVPNGKLVYYMVLLNFYKKFSIPAFSLPVILFMVVG